MSIYSILRRLYYALEAKKRKKYLAALTGRGLKLGKNVELVSDYFFDPSHCFLISIGDNTTIAPNVRLIAHDASTKKLLGYTKIGKIDIGKNCFIGDSVTVLLNVKIGDNSVIGAGSVVTKDVPPNSIVAGNPARVIAAVGDYAAKMKDISSGKKIFGEDYYIERLTDEKREEVLRAVKDGIGFIV